MQQSTDEIIDLDILITPETVFFFDLDETLVDTDFVNFLSYKKAIMSVTKSDHNLTYNPNKRFNRSVLKEMFPTLSLSEFEKITSKKEEYYNDFISDTKLNNALADIVIRYSKTNRIVLVTNCKEARARKTLENFNLLNYFDDAFYKESFPDGLDSNKFQNAISRLGIDPGLIIAFENEEDEILNAQKAGILKINPKYF